MHAHLSKTGSIRQLSHVSGVFCIYGLAPSYATAHVHSYITSMHVHVFIFTVQLSPSDKLYFNTLHDAAYNGRGMWHNIGIRLGLSEFDLDAIQTNNLSKVEGCYRAMLLKWFQSSPNCYLDIFLSALKSENVGLLHLYSKVEEAILKIAFPGQGNNRKRSAKRMYF